MKILQINEEWQIAVDGHCNYMPERYVKREGGKIVGGKETVAFEGWDRQSVFLSNEVQAVQWIAKKINHEGGDQYIIDSLEGIVKTAMSLLDQLKEQSK